MNEEILEAILKNFGELSIKRGNKFTLLRIGIELTDDEKVKIFLK